MSTEEHVHDLFHRSVATFAPDLDLAETVKLLLADARALQLVGGRYEDCARRIADDFERWANHGSKPFVIREETFGEWRVQLMFAGPGKYNTDLRRTPAEGWVTYHFKTRVEAWDTAVKEAKARALADVVGQASSRLGPDAYRESEILAAVKVELAKHAHIVGETTSGPVTPMETLTYDEFTAKYGIRDDLVRAPRTPEQQAKLDRWYQETMAKRPPLPVSRGEWHPEDAADRARAMVGKGAAPAVYLPRLIGRPTFFEALQSLGADMEAVTQEQADEASRIAHGPLPATQGAMVIPAEDPFQRAQRLALNTSADRAQQRLAEQAGRLNRIQYKPLYEPAPVVHGLPRYSAKPKPPRPPKSPEAKAEKRSRKASKNSVKKRRGWL